MLSRRRPDVSTAIGNRQHLYRGLRMRPLKRRAFGGMLLMTGGDGF